MAASKCRSGPETGREVRRVTADLGEYLSSDRYPLHSRLPPERQLCELLQISRTALRNGLEELEREGHAVQHWRAAAVVKSFKSAGNLAPRSSLDNGRWFDADLEPTGGSARQRHS